MKIPKTILSFAINVDGNKILKKILITIIAGLTLTSCQLQSAPVYKSSYMTDSWINNLPPHKQGILKPSDKVTDMAIDGRGFFIVKSPDNGKIYYTRDGSFNINEKGQLVCKNGYLVDPPVIIPKGQNFSVDECGRIWKKNDTPSPSCISQINIACFPNPDGLEQPLEIKNTNFYAQSASSGQPVIAAPKLSVAGAIIANALEDLSMSPVTVPNKNCYNEFSNITQKTNEFTRTDKATDLAIEGKGFFVITDPVNGVKYYTRSESFIISESGWFIIKMNSYSTTPYHIAPLIIIPQGQTFSRIDENGKVWTKGIDNKETESAQITIAVFLKPEGLKPFSFAHGNYYMESEESGKPVITSPKENGAGSIVSGFLQNCGNK